MAGTTRKPEVVIIDDELDGAPRTLAAELKKKGATATLLEPENVRKQHLERADVVLIDFELSNWSERDSVGNAASRKPSDGLAVAATLRRHLSDDGGIPPTAFAMYTGQIDQLAAPLPPDNRLHTLARLVNLEWVFKKNDCPAARVVAFAEAVQRLPHTTPFNIKKWLSINKSNLETRYAEDASSCLPPVRELSKWSHGITMIRWFLHRIIPYPCFLWDSHRVACRLRVTHESLKNILQSRSKFRFQLGQYLYKGSLSEFDGPRWWRAGIEQFVWEKTGGRSMDDEAVRSAVTKASSKKLHPLNLNYPVVCVDTDYQPDARPCEIDEAVRIRPDDWPAFAEPAWMRIELVNDEGFKAIVVPEDRERLK